MPTWDKDRPDGNAAWNVGGARVRENFEYIEQALQAITTFANNASDPTSNIYSKVGVGLFANRPAMGTAAQTNVAYFATDQGRWYICTDGVLNTWVELTAVGGALTVGGALNVDGAADFDSTVDMTGGTLTTAAVVVSAGDLVIGSGRKLRSTLGELYLRENNDPATDMRAHAHIDRHQDTGVEGAWIRGADPLRGLLVRAPKTASSSSVSALTGSYVSKVSTTYNLTGRTNASRIVVAGVVNVESVAGGAVGMIADARVTVNAAASSLAPVSRGSTAPYSTFNSYAPLFLVDQFDVAAGTNYAYALEVRAPSIAGTANFFSGYMMIFDFGEIS